MVWDEIGLGGIEKCVGVVEFFGVVYLFGSDGISDGLVFFFDGGVFELGS